MNVPLSLSTRKRWLLSLLLALLISTALCTCTYTEFVKIRMKILDGDFEVKSGPVDLPFKAKRTERKSLRILTLKAVNPQNATQTVQVLLNSEPVGTLALPPASSSRLNLEIPENTITEKKNLLTLQRDGGWTIQQLELGNVYGFSGRILKFVLTTNDESRYASPSLVTAFALLLLLALLGFFFPWQNNFSVLKVHRMILYVILSFLAITVLLPVATKYRLLFAVRSFSPFVLFAYLPATYEAYRTGIRKAEARFPETRVYVKYAFVILVVFLFFFSSMFYDLNQFSGNYTGFLHLSEKRFSKIPFADELDKDLVTTKAGYDGQFFYLMTFDPFLSRFQDKPEEYKNLVDVPPFRYRRVGYSILTRVFSWNQPQLYPETMIFLILCSSALGAFSLARIAVLHGQSPLWALLYVLIPGFSISLKTALPEPVSSALLLAGVYYYLKRKLPLSSLFFAFSILVRETGILLVFVIFLCEWFQRKDLRGAVTVAVAVIPHFLWRLFITWRLFPVYGWEGFYYEPGNLSWPFAGIAQVYSAIHSGEYMSAIVPAGLVFPVLLSLLSLFSVLLLRKQRDFLTWSFFAYSVIAVSLNYRKVWVQVANVERQSFEAFLCFLILFLCLPKDRRLFRYAFGGFFALLLLYDCFWLSEALSFQAGLMLKEVLHYLFIG